LRIHQIITLFIMLIIVIGIILFRVTGLNPLIAQSDIHIDPAEYRADISLRCLNSRFRSDVIFVTDLETPLQFQYDLTLSKKPPAGYLPAPSNQAWHVTSGRVEERSGKAYWTGAYDGLQVITLSGQVKFIPPEPTGLFAKKLPEITIPYEASIDCFFPRKVEEIVDGKVNGFEVGIYPDPTDPEYLKQTSNAAVVKAHKQIYQPPKYFYPVTPDTYRLKIFKDYTLGDFDLDPRFIKLTYPRYIAINPKIFVKLEMLEQVVRDQGVALSKFKIFYGFRSPLYNIGSRENDGGTTLKSPFSTHMYGMAVDIMIDEDNDLVIDDLNRDGKITHADAVVLLKYVNILDKKLLEEKSDLLGGAGSYIHHDFWERGEYVQSPYVHIDVRGYRARWGAKDSIGILKEKEPYRLKKLIPSWPF